MIKLKTVDDGTILPVRAQPGASRDGIRGWRDGLLRVSVTQVAEHGKANKALRAVIAQGLSLRRWQIELLSGASSQQKRFLISGIDTAELVKRIETVSKTST